MRVLKAKHLGFLIAAAFSASCLAATVNMGTVSFDITNAPLAEFDIANQTGPNASTFPDTTFPVTTSVSLSSLSLTVNFVTGPSSTFGASYFTLTSDGLSFDGQDIFNTLTNPVASATLTGTFDTTSLTLNDGSTVRISPDFTSTITDPSGVLVDGDFALMVGSTGIGPPPVPEPGTWGLLACGFIALVLVLKKAVRAKRALMLLAVCLLLLPLHLSAAPTAVKLNVTTTPSSGVAGSTDVWVTGEGFPGAPTTAGATIKLATTCGGSPSTTAVPLAVRNIVGSSYKIEFQVPGSLSSGGYFVSISGTTSTGTAFASSNCSSLQVTSSSVTFSSCNPGSSMGMVVPNRSVTGITPVTAYVPNSNWGRNTTGVRVVPIEGSGSPAAVTTPHGANSCSSNSQTGETVCVANDTDVYLITGTTLNTTLTSSANTFASFSGGSCENCGVAVNAARNQAVIQIGLSTAPSGSALQFLNLATSTLGTPVPASHEVAEDILWDPFTNYVLSPSEFSDIYDLFKVSTSLGVTPGPSTVAEFGNPVSPPFGGAFDSAGEDCSTSIALSTLEGTGQLYIADLKQATFTPGTPGTWTTSGQQVQNFPEFRGLAAGTSAIAIAPGTTHLGVVAGEFGGSLVGAIQLPSTSGSGTPAVVDWVVATLPHTPDGDAFSNGFDPHTTTAYTSPNTGKAYGVAASWASGGPAYLAIIDLQALLGATRTSPGSHTVSSSVDLLATGIVRYVATF